MERLSDAQWKDEVRAIVGAWAIDDTSADGQIDLAVDLVLSHAITRFKCGCAFVYKDSGCVWRIYRDWPRAEVVDFAQVMERKLAKNDAAFGAHGYQSMSWSSLVYALRTHVDKASQQNNAGAWADVANFAMFLAWHADRQAAENGREGGNKPSTTDVMISDLERGLVRQGVLIPPDEEKRGKIAPIGPSEANTGSIPPLEILQMILTGHFGAPNSLFDEKRRNEWPQVAPAIRYALAEIDRLRKENECAVIEKRSDRDASLSFCCNWESGGGLYFPERLDGTGEEKGFVDLSGALFHLDGLRGVLGGHCGQGFALESAVGAFGAAGDAFHARSNQLCTLADEMDRAG